MSLTQRVVFRVDESSQIGMGHMSRCRALADALVRKGAEVSFYCRGVHHANREALQKIGVTVVDLMDEQTFLNQDWRSCIVVIDGYHFDRDFWQRLIAAGVSRTVCIDDFRAIPYFADIVICYNEGVSPEQFDLAPHTRLFLGARYLLLRPEILAASQLANRTAPRRSLMIAAGGTRQESWVAVMLAHLSSIAPSVPIWVLSGRRLATGKVLHQAGLNRGQVRFFNGLGANRMIHLYSRASCLLVPASTMMLEAFSAGCPIVTGWIADNQRNSLESYGRKELIVNAGDLSQLSLAALTAACAKARRQSGLMARRQRAYIRSSKTGVDEIVKAILEST